MVVSLQALVFVAVLVTVSGAALDRSFTMPNQNFQAALLLVKNTAAQEGNINYNAFCSERNAGIFKLACRIEQMPDIGLLVCLQDFGCENKLQAELDGLVRLRNANLNVVPFFNQVINNLKCGDEGEGVNCFGFLVEWIPANQGTWQELRTNFRGNNIANLMNWLMNYQNEAARMVTLNDFTAVLQYTHPPNNVYNRICDFQGFFMVNGGFKIMDPFSVVVNSPPEYRCADPNAYATTVQVINVLQQIIQYLENHHMKV